jgi:hypothetical protein
MAVRGAMVEVEYNNSEHNGQRTHEHDRGEVCACHVQHNRGFITTSIIAFNSRSLFEFVRCNTFTLYLPISGTASEVCGILSDTIMEKTVSDRRMVTPASRDTSAQYSIHI